MIDKLLLLSWAKEVLFILTFFAFMMNKSIHESEKEQFSIVAAIFSPEIHTVLVIEFYMKEQFFRLSISLLETSIIPLSEVLLQFVIVTYSKETL